MTNQTVEPGNTSDILYFMRVLLFVALLSLGYQLSRPQTASNKEQGLLLNDTARLSQDPEWPGLPLWQRKVSDRAVERYTNSQEKKWRRWNEAMFERSG